MKKPYRNYDVIVSPLKPNPLDDGLRFEVRVLAGSAAHARRLIQRYMSVQLVSKPIAQKRLPKGCLTIDQVRAIESLSVSPIVDGLTDQFAPPLAQTCTRSLPHICTVNGPCNGFPAL
jgi:hypothetical protein